MYEDAAVTWREEQEGKTLQYFCTKLNTGIYTSSHTDTLQHSAHTSHQRHQIPVRPEMQVMVWVFKRSFTLPISGH